MGRKLMFVVGLGAGYVLGARAGREPYEKLAAATQKVWDSPRVAKARADVEAYARTQAPIIAERAEAAAKAAPGLITDGAQKAAEAAADAAGRATTTVHEIADRTTIIARDVAGRTTVIARKITGAQPEVVGPLES